MADLTITRDHYYRREQPEKSEEMVNRVEITTQPLLPETELSTVYTSDTITIDAYDSYTLTAEYGSPPVLTSGASSSITDSEGGTLTILSSTYYPWGAEVIVENNTATEGSGKVEIEGFALEVQGKETVSSEDSDSIDDNRLMKYEYPKNHLIQNAEIAQLIADTLLSSYKQYRKDVNLQWRGNPALELGDTITVTVYKRGDTEVTQDFKVYKNQIEFDGTLKQTTDGRKI